MLKLLREQFLALIIVTACFAGNAAQANSFEPAKTDLHSTQQNGRLSGTVADEFGPVAGASVLVKGTTNGTITDANGQFTLDGVKNGDVLQVSFIGYVQQDINFTGQTRLEVILKEDSQAIEEVVVVGYGVVKKSDLTGAVGSVNAGTIAAKGTTTLMESLQGQVAGVNISQSSSRAGDGFNIQIRGKNSLGGGNPLYVIDGVVSESMDFLNPMDIEKVDILKDASSTAIYGSRATNGVVMITTKKGDATATKTTLSYDGYYGVKTTANMPDFMNGDQFMNWRFSRYLMPNGDFTNWTMSDSDYSNFWGAGSQVVKDMYRDKRYTDWTDVVTRDGSQQNHFVNVTGNAKNINYRIGMGYQNEEGVLYDNYERWNIKGTVDHKISDKFTAGFSTNMATALKESGSNNSILEGFRMTPLMPAYYWDGENNGEPIWQPGKDAVVYPNGGGPTSSINPIVDRLNAKNDTRTYNVLANVYLQYSPLPEELILKTTFSPMYSKSHKGVFYNSLTQERSGKSNLTENYNDQTFSYTWDNQVNYIKSVGEHKFNALALLSIYQQQIDGDFISVVDMPFDVDWYNLGSGTVQNQSSYYEKISMLSYVARINYSFKGKYMATVSSRWDGSSKFLKDNRWGMFPSAALAWRISEESFLGNTGKWLSNLKLRASYGMTGNNAGIGAYDTQALANIKYYYNFGNTAANGYGYTMTNTNLTWEKTTEFNVGIDFGLFDNKINGSVDLYDKNSKDLLMEMETPFELGSSTGSIVSNVGKVNNKGIEIQLNTVNVATNDWRWETSFSFNRNINAIQELNGAKEDLVGNKWFIGQPVDVVYGFKYTGICTREEAQNFKNDPNWTTKFHEGEMKISDEDNNGIIDANDKIVLGHYAPAWTGGLVSNLSYKNFDLSVNVYTSQGGTVYAPFMGEFVDYLQRGMERLNIDYYIPEGAPILGADGSIAKQATTHYGNYPFPHNGSNGKGGGVYWTDGDLDDRAQNFVDNSYVKIKNIALGYSFPKKWLNQARLSYLRIYANIANPFIFTDYVGFDPEWADSTIGDGKGGVSSKTFQIGINLKF
jgi:TonB-linked SusC/RagA family outer membrane protein